MNIGAREYDTVAGRFVSVDPIIDVNDPQQMNGYAYANNNPVSYSDPDGLRACADDACGPGADYEDMYGNYHKVKGHNDGCGGCSGAYDPDEPKINVHNNPRASAQERAVAARAAAEKERQRRIAAAKAKMLNAAKALAKILMDELGITDALDCFLKGDMGGCLATAANVAGAAIGGALGKLAARYGAPWKWKKFANLTSRVKGLLGDLIGGVKSYLKCAKHSFAPGTLVLLADGSVRPIEAVRTGDRVVAEDPETGAAGVREVVATHVNLDVELADLTLSTVAGPVLVETTVDHPFWSRDRSAWVGAGGLRAGERMLSADGAPVTVSQVRSHLGQRVMYDLTIDNIHTYYVLAGNTPVLVHNCGSQTLYRSDTRDPSEIFANGFESRGDNMDVLEHASGWSRDSGYVSTTTSERVAINRGGNVYEVRADGVDVNKEFPGNPFSHEREVAVPRSIAPECIVSCRLPDGARVVNPNYGGGR
ncbi:intein C-terminal splicing region/RHS repeat-associated core domain-containing protein [Micromonospora yangpuensis]|uniref:Intein C-terminal splicing region/RHS repeat-associated core domain-containing protein n=1 Tax=Micromonospora yangpuensis TaxID=683228 RepID=A0A1C6UME6_9ACTN|nr:intein C-terminal splicing region/RHS repeat-associated core domain-containing protein [Micromonospora yangpuensis]